MLDVGPGFVACSIFFINLICNIICVCYMFDDGHGWTDGKLEISLFDA